MVWRCMVQSLTITQEQYSSIVKGFQNLEHWLLIAEIDFRQMNQQFGNGFANFSLKHIT